MPTSASRLQAHTLPAIQGWAWVRQGWQLYRRQSIALTALFTTNLFAFIVCSVIVGFIEKSLADSLPIVMNRIVDVLGATLVIAFVPGMTASFMEACRRVEAGQRLRFDVLLAAFTSGRQLRRQLILLGIVQAVGFYLAASLIPTPILPAIPNEAAIAVPNATPSPSITQGTQSSPSSANSRPGNEVATAAPQAPNNEELFRQQQQLLLVSLERMLVYLPFSILLWYAPMLVFWQRCGNLKAMFFSAAAVWRNRGAFLVYILGLWAVLIAAAVVMSLLVAVIGQLLGAGNAVFIVIAPLFMGLLAFSYCTIYLSYATVFDSGEDEVSSSPGQT